MLPKSIWGFFKISETLEKIIEICETVLVQTSLPNVDRKGICFIWLKLKSREAELKKQVTVSLAKYMLMFRHIKTTK